MEKTNSMVEEMGKIAKEKGIVVITATQMNRPNRKYIDPNKSIEICANTYGFMIDYIDRIDRKG
jgi:hypothetical protein